MFAAAPSGNTDMRANDERCLTYTSAVLGQAVETAGSPVVTLWVSSTADDGDFFIYLEQVNPDGSVGYVTEGVLRASHRAMSIPPYNNVGLPYHRSWREDMRPIGADPVRLVCALSPIAWQFPAGSRIRVSIAGSDADNALTPRLVPAPVIRVHRSAQHASFLDLPVHDDTDRSVLR
jgi:putative CocE/NonD family hydrolase